MNSPPLHKLRRLIFEPLEERRLLTIDLPLDSVSLSNENFLPSSESSAMLAAANQSASSSPSWKRHFTESVTAEAEPFSGTDTGIAEFPFLPKSLTNINGIIYFAANDGLSGTELWKSDGTRQGTLRVTDLYPGSFSSNPNSLTNVNGTLYFSAYSPQVGRELWKVTDANSGAQLVKDIFAGQVSFGIGPNSSSPRRLTNIDGTLYFAANDGTTGHELWKSNGTESGTRLVRDIRPGIQSFITSYWDDPPIFVDVSGTLFFLADDGRSGIELWKSDGTRSGTAMVKDLSPGHGSGISNLTNVNGILYFKALGGQLWRSNGTAAGTNVVKSFGGEWGTSPRQLTNVGGILYFSANDGSSGYELWRSDGSNVGTKLVKDIGAGLSSSFPRDLTNVAGMLFFTAADETGTALWKSDGTDAGTVKVKGSFSDSERSRPSNLIDWNGLLFFSTWNPAKGYELWRSDGTENGTRSVLTIRSGDSGESLEDLAVAGDRLFFAVSTGDNRYELYSLKYSRSLWSNLLDPLDVNADGLVSALDALTVINYLNSSSSRMLFGSDTPLFPHIDVNGDERVSALDALLVINHLNQRTPEPERLNSEGESSYREIDSGIIQALELARSISTEGGMFFPVPIWGSALFHVIPANSMSEEVLRYRSASREAPTIEKVSGLNNPFL